LEHDNAHYSVKYTAINWRRLFSFLRLWISLFRSSWRFLSRSWSNQAQGAYARYYWSLGHKFLNRLRSTNKLLCFNWRRNTSANGREGSPAPPPAIRWSSWPT